MKSISWRRGLLFPHDGVIPEFTFVPAELQTTITECFPILSRNQTWTPPRHGQGRGCRDFRIRIGKIPDDDLLRLLPAHHLDQLSRRSGPFFELTIFT